MHFALHAAGQQRWQKSGSNDSGTVVSIFPFLYMNCSGNIHYRAGISGRAGTLLLSCSRGHGLRSGVIRLQHLLAQVYQMGGQGVDELADLC